MHEKDFDVNYDISRPALSAGVVCNDYHTRVSPKSPVSSDFETYSRSCDSEKLFVPFAHFAASFWEMVGGWL